ncbi:MAG: leucyl aminopeptidase [Noviherbaspirillum sp.]
MEMLALFEEEFRLCRVRPGEVVAVLSATGEWPEYVMAFQAAAQRLGATAFHLSVPRIQAQAAGVQGQHPLVGNRLAIDTLKRADLVIDLMGLLFSAEQLEIQAAGARILRVMEPLHVLKQMFPTEGLRRRTDFAHKFLSAAREMRIASPGGTDVRYGLSQYSVMSEYGYTDEPGRWDNFPSGFVFTQGNDGEVDGTVVLMPGDIIAAFKRYVETPVRFRIEKGYIVEIAGEGVDAVMIREYIESFNDPRAYAIAHIGWGLNERANWHHMAATKHLDQEHVMHALSFYGNVLFSTGPNTEFGGTNDTKCHMDLPMRGCSLWVDDIQVLEGGKIVHPDMRIPGR